MKAKPIMDTLWRAKLKLGQEAVRDISARDREFLFREIDDFGKASVTAVKLLEGSTAAKIAGAEVVAVERVAHLWN